MRLKVCLNVGILSKLFLLKESFDELPKLIKNTVCIANLDKLCIIEINTWLYITQAVELN